MKSKILSLKQVAIIITFWSINAVLYHLSLEPYPTLLMPAGAGNLQKDINDNVYISITKMYALNDKNRWEEVDLKKMAYKLTAPNFYLDRVGYGLFRDESQTEKVKRKLGLVDDEENHKMRTELVKWFAKGLEGQGLQTDSVKLVSFSYQLSLETKEIIERKILNEKISVLF